MITGVIEVAMKAVQSRLYVGRNSEAYCAVPTYILVKLPGALVGRNSEAYCAADAHFGQSAGALVGRNSEAYCAARAAWRIAVQLSMRLTI
jgi:hypothetical protein